MNITDVFGSLYLAATSPKIAANSIFPLQRQTIRCSNSFIDTITIFFNGNRPNCSAVGVFAFEVTRDAQGSNLSCLNIRRKCSPVAQLICWLACDDEKVFNCVSAIPAPANCHRATWSRPSSPGSIASDNSFQVLHNHGSRSLSIGSSEYAVIFDSMNIFTSALVIIASTAFLSAPTASRYRILRPSRYVPLLQSVRARRLRSLAEVFCIVFSAF